MVLWMVMISKNKVPTALVKNLGMSAIERRLSLRCNQRRKRMSLRIESIKKRKE
jgi:hypothetical protein